ncbi:1-phosphatidylinositol phosphodiesterase-like [Cotesia typhae]|uniref:1-phosphatidylinositol phosphodiesterase-like n=1 Tax=Cotesia typhae TaxID=2053667 RepID=UPI003D696967
MWKIPIQFILLHIIVINGCFTTCPNYHYKPHSTHAEFLTLLPDDRNMSDIALVGTQSSAIDSHQSLSINDQLEFGVRVFDITVRPFSDELAVYDDLVFAYQTFGDILDVFVQFLVDHPEEFLIVLMNQAHIMPYNTSKSVCQILETYLKPNMLKIWSLNAKIKEYRGKILFATINDWSFNDCVVHLGSRCLVSSDFRVNDGDVEDLALEEIKAIEFMKLQDASFLENHKCFINIVALKNRKGSITYKVAIEGLGGSYCSMPMNVRVANTFVNPHRALIILLTDFPTQELIKHVINSNNHNYSKNVWDVDAHYDPKVDITNFMSKIQ